MNKEETFAYLEKLDRKPKMLLHACCAPCTTGMYLELSERFEVTILYYNPNTYPKEEYDLRLEMIKKLKETYGFEYISCDYDSNEYEEVIKGKDTSHEGGERCYYCYELRLKKCAELAKKLGFDIFTSTLSVSPYKNASWLNEIGNRLEKEFGVTYFYSDFKKNDGYKKSCQRSKDLGLYRQEYCGCRFSLEEENKKKLNYDIIK